MMLFPIKALLLISSVYTTTLLSSAAALLPGEALRDVRAVSSEPLEIRAPNSPVVTPPEFGGEVSYTDMTSGDVQKQGADPNKIWYISETLKHDIAVRPKEKRTGIFFTGGNWLDPTFWDMVNKFNSEKLKGNGMVFYDVASVGDMAKQGISRNDRNNLYWRFVYRSSKALALASTNEVAYVAIVKKNGRTIWSPPSKDPKDVDPAHNKQATVGEVWHYGELPTLMRNTNIKQIVAFWMEGKDFKTEVAWDVNKDTDKPRDYLPDISFDATPIVLPPAADRPPMKREQDE